MSPPPLLSEALPVTFVTRADGLPSAQIHQIAVDRDNCIWAAGPSGLAMYDGARVAVYNKHHGLSTHGLRAVTADTDGTLWIGSDVGLDRFDPRPSSARVKQIAHWDDRVVERVACAPDGTVYAGTSSGLLAQQPDGSFANVPDHGLGSAFIRDLTVDSVGRLWAIAAPASLFMLEGRRWAPVGISAAVPATALNQVIATGADTLFASGSHGIYQIRVRDGVAHASMIVETPTAISALLLTGSTLWVGTQQELRWYDAHRGTWALSGSAVAGITVNDLALDHQGNIWGATESKGLLKVSATRSAVRCLRTPTSSAVLTIRRLRSSDYLVGGEHGAATIAPIEALTPSALTHEPPPGIWDVLETSDGDLLYATRHGLFVSRGAMREPQHIGQADPVLRAPNRCLLEQGDSIWVGTLAGLARISGDVAAPKIVSDTSLGYVYSLTAGASGTVWIATLGNGLWLDAGTGPQRVSGEGLLDTGNTYAVALRPQGGVAVTQDDRIILINASGTSRILAETEESVAGWSAVFERDDHLWVGSSAGLSEYDATSGRELRHLSVRTGLEDWEFTTSRSLDVDQRGRLWCGLNSGLAVVDPHQLDALSDPPVAKLRSTVWYNAEPQEIDGVWHVAHGRWTVTLNVFSAWLIDEASVKFRHMLVGFDMFWSEPTSSGTILFTSLPAGDYMLEVQAYSPLTGWGPVSTVAKIAVRTSLLYRAAAAPLYAAARIRYLLSRTRYRNRALLEQRAQLEERIQLRTAELERANSALEIANRKLSELARTDTLTGVANRRAFDETFDREWRRAARAGEPLVLALIDIDHFKSYNDSLGHQAGDTCLARVAQALQLRVRDAGDLVARIGGEEFAVLLTGADRNQAATTLDRLREAVAHLDIAHPASPTAPHITVSVGYCVTSPSINSTEALFAAADRALYLAKQAGRNRCVASE